MRGQAGFWDVDDRYALLSKAGDQLDASKNLVGSNVF
jgi:hypothetical protein